MINLTKLITSGIASNPAVRVAGDLIVENGERTTLSEASEFVGAEHLGFGEFPHI